MCQGLIFPSLSQILSEDSESFVDESGTQDGGDPGMVRRGTDLHYIESCQTVPDHVDGLLHLYREQAERLGRSGTGCVCWVYTVYVDRQVYLVSFETVKGLLDTPFDSVIEDVESV